MNNPENFIDEHNTIEKERFAKDAAEALMARIEEMREDKKEKGEGKCLQKNS